MERVMRSATIKLGNKFLTPAVIGSNGLNFQECIAELVANALDWRITKRSSEEKTVIRILMSDNHVQIVDNGVGMNYEELDIALDLAESGDDRRDRLDEEARKGMYGLGMKVAVLSLGWKFTINTISAKEPEVEYVFEFDARNLEDKKSDYLKKLGISSGPRIAGSPLQEFPSGTSIMITDLEKRAISVVALGKELEMRFSPDINNLLAQEKLEFTIQDEDSTYTLRKNDVSALFEDEVLKVDFGSPGKWAKRKEYKYVGSDGKEYQLKGYIQLLKERKVAEQTFGLNLYCKGQLIERYHKVKTEDGLFSMPGRSGEKTYGELHLDGCLPDNVKAKGFIRDAAFKAIRELISDDLEVYKFLSPTSNAATSRIRDEINKRKGLGTRSGTGPNPEPGDEPPGGEEPGDNPGGEPGGDGTDQPGGTEDPPPNLPEGTIRIAKHLLIQVQSIWVHMHGLDDKNEVSWEPIYLKSKNNDDLWELKVYINPGSNLYKAIETNYSYKGEQFKVLDFFKRMVVSESINQKLILEHGYSREDARELTDRIVYPFVMQMKLD